MINKKTTTLLLSALILLSASTGWSQEYIKKFRSDVTINREALLLVTETIDINVMGYKVKKGIFRDLPTFYKTKKGKKIKRPIKIVKVTRDGQKEPWHTENITNGIRLYIGNRKVNVKPGLHRYTISYSVNRMVGFYKNHDELYWNVTGNEWAFPIEKALCYVYLPEETQILQTGVWTGIRGSKDSNAVVKTTDTGGLLFETTTPLKPGEGMTVALTWPSGIVEAPAESDYFLTDHGLEITFIVTAFFSSVLFFLLWFRFGRDPRRGTIVPLFRPPEKMSASCMRRIKNMDFDDITLTSAIISLAVKGHITIKEEKKKYQLYKNGNNHKKKPLEEEEKKLLKTILGSRKKISIEKKNNETIGAARESLKNSLLVKCSPYYEENWGYTVMAVLTVAAILVLGSVLSSDGEEMLQAIVSTVIATATSVTFTSLMGTFRKRWVNSHGLRTLWVAITAVIAIFGTVTAFLISMMIAVVFLPPLCAKVLPVIAFTPAIFIPIMKRPTLEGRRLMDQIEGFSLYLRVAEEDRLNMLNPPEKTPELFERYLPYAFALGATKQWGEKFSSILSQNADDPYSPGWYIGTHPIYMTGFGAFTSDMSSSLSSAVAASAQTPGSGSAFSDGGGFSGGGGGGGGGGGW